MQSEAARDVIARAVEDSSPDPQAHADYLVAELTAAGYRILGPDELDPVTVERCANVALDIGSTQSKGWETHPMKNGCGGSVAASNTGYFIALAIRSFSPSPQPEDKEARDGR